ncbi:hypothetical protein XI03_19810 [Bradyrhizobium sp. CCBAU 65884]|nr:hypothetical protein [Bradyrhizobium sp. CCBAU 65884]
MCHSQKADLNQRPETRPASNGLTSASANEPCRDNHSMLCKGLPRLFAELAWCAATMAIKAAASRPF